MNIQLKAGSPLNVPSDALVLGLFAEDPLKDPLVAEIDKGAGGAIARAIEAGDFKPERNETMALAGVLKGKHLVLVGLGARAEWSAEHLRQAAGSGARAAHDLKGRRLAIANLKLADAADTVQALVEGAQLALYTFDSHRGTLTKDDVEPPVERLTLVMDRVNAAAELGLDRGVAIAEAVHWIRDLVNLPAGDLPASRLADEARGMAEPRGLTVKVLGKAELKRMGMGCLLAVNAGSTQPPAFIVVEYWGGQKGVAPIALIGKGISFDTGGINIKPAAGLDEMKTDMAGGGAVLGAIRAIADLKLPVNVVGCIPSTDNAIGGSATHPGDVVTSFKGLSVEIIDTDAEGRLILADALAYAEKTYEPSVMIDLATLTGSIMVALGGHVTGLFTQDDALAERLYATGQETGERMWRMPMWDAYADMVESAIADVKNADPRRGDAIAASKFLEKFVSPGTSWAHLDIAGPSWIEDDRPYEPKGATGHGVRLLVEYARRYGATAKSAGSKPSTKRSKRG